MCYTLLSAKTVPRHIYLRVLPPLRDEELPPERKPPPDIPPDERMVLDDDERTVLGADERIVLDEEERTAELLERDGVLDERTAEDERDGVAEVLTLEREGCVRVVVLTPLLRVALVREGATVPRWVVVEVRVVVVVVAEVRVALPRVALPRVAVPRTLVLPYVALRDACAALPRVVDDVLARVAEPLLVVVRVALASRTAVRRLCSKARALLTLREALRVANERSGWRCAKSLRRTRSYIL